MWSNSLKIEKPDVPPKDPKERDGLAFGAEGPGHVAKLPQPKELKARTPFGPREGSHSAGRLRSARQARADDPRGGPVRDAGLAAHGYFVSRAPGPGLPVLACHLRGSSSR